MLQDNLDHHSHELRWVMLGVIDLGCQLHGTFRNGLIKQSPQHIHGRCLTGGLTLGFRDARSRSLLLPTVFPLLVLGQVLVVLCYSILVLVPLSFHSIVLFLQGFPLLLRDLAPVGCLGGHTFFIERAEFAFVLAGLEMLSWLDKTFRCFRLLRRLHLGWLLGSLDFDPFPDRLLIAQDHELLHQGVLYIRGLEASVLQTLDLLGHCFVLPDFGIQLWTRDLVNLVGPNRSVSVIWHFLHDHHQGCPGCR
mmetsp:Transcript_35342/g.79272  ORF Transcript_35342/g.79272 Transcript_35342/m.79272 type:complete len:250 (-) Transcript_35342:4-753(-)